MATAFLYNFHILYVSISDKKFTILQKCWVVRFRSNIAQYNKNVKVCFTGMDCNIFARLSKKFPSHKIFHRGKTRL